MTPAAVGVAATNAISGVIGMMVISEGTSSHTFSAKEVTEVTVPERSHPEKTVLVAPVQVAEPAYVDPIEVMFVAKQLDVMLVTVLMFEHSVVALVVVIPVTSQPENVVALLVHSVRVSLPEPVRMVHSFVTWLAVWVSHPELNDVIVEGCIEHPSRGEPVAVDVQLVEVIPLLAVMTMQCAV